MPEKRKGTGKGKEKPCGLADPEIQSVSKEKI
jgi:hypothetical protein